MVFLLAMSTSHIVSTHIAIINACTAVTDAQIAALVPDLRTQVSRDFAPAWGIDASLTFVPKGKTPPKGAWWLSLMDNSDEQGALGYHDVTSEGLPLGKAFIATDIKYGYNWTITVSHELLEMLADPEIDLTVFDQKSNTAGTLYAYEVCDACEDDSFGYVVGAHTLSDFVYPAWFESTLKPGSTKMDHMGHISSPFQLLQGGYIGIYKVGQGGGWTQLTAEHKPNFKSRAHVGSRRERRNIPRDLWMKSTAHAE